MQRISTHALTEGDLDWQNTNISGYRFQLTPSRRATAELNALLNMDEISTHALTEGDTSNPLLNMKGAHFNSRPHGGRPIFPTICSGCSTFQLTPSRRATKVCVAYTGSHFISTHALTEGDAIATVGGAVAIHISTHALTEGDDV